MSNQQQSTTISLEQMATRYLDALQKIHDMVCFTLAGARGISERDYDEFSQQLQVMPRQQSRREFENAKITTQRWILRNSLGDALALVAPIMEDCRTICELCDAKAESKTDATSLAAIRGDNRQKFLQLKPEKKFDDLAERFNIQCDVKSHVLNLLHVTRSLMTNDGVLAKEDCDAEGGITLRIRSVQLAQSPDEADKLVLKRQIADSERRIQAGEEINFSKAEHIGSLLTIGVFVTEMLQGLQNYAKATGNARETA